MWRKREKLDFLEKGQIPWTTLLPDALHTWLVPEHADEWRELPAMGEMFELHSRGLETTRDDVVYDFDRSKLISRIKKFVSDYNAEVDRHRHEKNADFPHHIKWSSRLKECLARGQYAEFSEPKIRPALYRPFTKRWVFFDSVLNQRTGQWPKISGPVIWRKVGPDWPFFALMSEVICDLLPQGGSQCFPLSQLKYATIADFRAHYSDPSITPEDVFHYLYALLHQPAYRERFAANLKRELPRIPFAPDFRPFAEAGRALARLHVDYESLPAWPLQSIENDTVPYSERVTKMKISETKDSIRVNESLTLTGIPPETFEYKLGSRSALEWVIDQYQIKGDSDPNREDDPHYIVLLLGQVVRVSVETVKIVSALPRPF